MISCLNWFCKPSSGGIESLPDIEEIILVTLRGSSQGSQRLKRNAEESVNSVERNDEHRFFLVPSSKKHPKKHDEDPSKPREIIQTLYKTPGICWAFCCFDANSWL